jgi:hypothetical protein
MVPLPTRLRRWLREPALQFAILGAALFALHFAVRGWAHDPRKIVVTRTLLEAERDDPPAESEEPLDEAQLPELVERAIDGEVLYREALAQGLDRDDLIVRRRLIQKMRFLAEDAAPPGQAGDEELEAVRKRRADLFTDPQRISLVHVFLSKERRGARLDADAALLRQRLPSLPPRSAGLTRLGDPFLAGHRLVLQTRDQLEATFGAAFAQSAFALESGTWSQPIASSYGLHLVYVEEKKGGGLLPLSQVRASAREVLLAERREEANRRVLAELRAKYRIEIEPGLLASPTSKRSAAR